jgi:hypothetical protein
MNECVKRLGKCSLLCCLLAVGYISYLWYLQPYFIPCNDEVADYDVADFQREFIKSAHGNIPIVLTAVHGGNFTSGCIRERTGGFDYNSAKTTDAYTIELLFELIAYLQTGYNITPSYVFTTLHRKYIDLNRDPSIANAYRDPRLEGFHDAFYNTVESHFSPYEKCLVIDIHGFSPYLLPSHLRDVDVFSGTLEGKTLISASREQLYSTLSQGGAEIWPNTNGQNEFFSGDYNLKRFVEHPKYQGVQLELTNRIRMTGLSTYDADLRGLVIANIAAYIAWWVGQNLST